MDLVKSNHEVHIYFFYNLLFTTIGLYIRFFFGTIYKYFIITCHRFMYMSCPHNAQTLYDTLIRWLDKSVCDNLKDGVFCCLSQIHLYYLCLKITNVFILWTWPHGVCVDRTTLKILCVNYFNCFYIIAQTPRFLSIHCKRSLLQQTVLLQQT